MTDRESNQELTIERIVAGGSGLAHTAEGVALVRGALPGERVLAALERKKGYFAGEVVDILDAHPHREFRPLPPGADLPLRYQEQLDVKSAIVLESLQRAGVTVGADVMQPIVASPEPLGYRTAAQYAVARDGRLAAREQRSRLLRPLDEDPLLAPPAARAFAALSGHMPSGVREVLIRASLLADSAVIGLVSDKSSRSRESEQALVGPDIAGVARMADRRIPDRGRNVAGEASLLEDFGGIHTTVTAQSFAQVNPKAAGLLYIDAAERAGTGDRVVDLYAGSGVLALHLAQKFAEVIAVETSVDAVRRGDADRQRLGIDTLRFHAGDAAAVAEHLPADLVSVNPPRSGMSAEVAAALGESDVARILYVSCDPPTWARDLARLTESGYTAVFARPYDFYPYTHHVEILTIMERG